MDRRGDVGGSNMRSAIVLAIACGAVSALATSATAAHAEEWCGYAPENNALIQCGYSTLAQCENGTGKGATCFVDPDYALNIKRTAHSIIPKAARG
jgi:Protein of unknown function (DUF3551)